MPDSNWKLSQRGTRTLACIGLALGLALLLAPAPTQAADFALKGLFRDNRGGLSLPMPYTLGVSVTPMGGLAGNYGRGVAGAGTVVQTGAPVPGGGPATIQFPKDAFSDPPQHGKQLIPIPSIIQLTTMFGHFGPTQTSTLMASRSGPANFAYCPGAAANPSCTTVTAGGAQGSKNGIVVYTAGPNRFGGTFHMLLSGTGLLVHKGGPLPPTVMTAMGATHTALPFSAINLALAGNVVIGAGGTFAKMSSGVLLSTPRTHPYGYMTTTYPGLLSPGPTVGPGITYLNTGTAFPMTTGMVYAYAKIGAQAEAGVPQIDTLTGYDKRTPMGAGRLFLVSANMSRSFPTDGSNPPEGSILNNARMFLTFTPQPSLALSSPALQGSLALLLLSAGGAVAWSRQRGRL